MSPSGSAQSNPSRTPTGRAFPVLAGWGLLLAAAAVYANTLRAPFVYLDVAGISGNPTIRHLWPIWDTLRPPLDRGITVEGRPLVNLTLALNYAISADRVWSYHVFNALIHGLAGMTLFGVIRRTLARLNDGRASLTAWMMALLWTVHPLQTESVTYTIQRAESLMGLFYLLTLYSFIRWLPGSGSGSLRGFRSPLSALWPAASVLCCLLGMATKEVMVSAPAIVLLYDRTFIAGDFRSALRRRPAYYAALFATWLPLAWLVHSAGGNRGGTSGFGLPISWWQYLCTQFPALLHYVRLCLWPHPLVFYYEVRWIHGLEAALPGLVVAAAAVAMAIGVLRRTAWGFLGTAFFAVLSPTSLIPGMSQTIAEHRMYLPLAVVLIGLVLGLRAAATPMPRFGWTVLAIIAVVFAVLTVRRNHVYRTEVSLWQDTVVHAPNNPYSQNNLGIALASAGRPAEAADCFHRAIALKADYPEAHDNLGLAYAESGRLTDAIAEYRRALEGRGGYAEARANLGVALMGTGQKAAAVEQFREAARLDPKNAQVGNNLAAALAASGQIDEAIAQYRRVLALNPASAETHFNLANAFAARGRWEDAAGEYRASVQFNPRSMDALSNLGAVLANLGQFAEAVEADRRAAALAPNDPDIRQNLGDALRSLGRGQEAEAELAAAARLRAVH